MTSANSVPTVPPKLRVQMNETGVTNAHGRFLDRGYAKFRSGSQQPRQPVSPDHRTHVRVVAVGKDAEDLLMCRREFFGECRIVALYPAARTA